MAKPCSIVQEAICLKMAWNIRTVRDCVQTRHVLCQALVGHIKLELHTNLVVVCGHALLPISSDTFHHVLSFSVHLL